MAKQHRSFHPADAANVFVRVILSEAGEILGGLTEEEWKETLDYFDGCCAYTGDPIGDGQLERDHAIPMNRQYCGIHLYGNVLPTTKAENRKKAGKHYNDFVGDEKQREKIEKFVAQSKYHQRIEKFGDIKHYCMAQYDMIVALCGVNKKYLMSLLPDSESFFQHAVITPSEIHGETAATQNDVLPVDFVPPIPEDFKRQLLEKQEAWITEIYENGEQRTSRWNASRMTSSSNVIRNIRSKLRYRRNNWKQEGIQRLLGSIEKPG